MIKRSIETKLLNWKNNHKNECLLVNGARQVGKTFSIREFGKKYYSNFIELNFIKEPKLKSIFDGSLNPDEIFSLISIYFKNFDLNNRDTLIFFDEIQECPNARTSEKFLAEDGRFDIICSGSLLGIEYKNNNSLPVGYENQITMYPLDFSEFLTTLGIGEEKFNQFITYFNNCNKIPDAINDRLHEYFRKYIVIGGMPKVVDTYLKTNSFSSVSNEQKKIIKLYLEDIEKYTKDNDKQLIKDAFESIPRQLARENKKFKLTEVSKSIGKDRIRNAINWLVNAGIVNRCYRLDSVNVPFSRYLDAHDFKIYMNDTGLLLELEGNSTDIKRQILMNQFKGESKGALYENVFANTLISKGHQLYYYKNDKGTQEIEFLITEDGNITPIEVKAGVNKAISLNNFVEQYKPYNAIKFTSGNVGRSENYKTFPIYLSSFLKGFNESNNDKIDDKII